MKHDSTIRSWAGVAGLLAAFALGAGTTWPGGARPGGQDPWPPGDPEAEAKARARTAALDALLEHVSVTTVPDGEGDPVPTLRIEGVDVQIVNGSGHSREANGVGNLVLGYNELGNADGDRRGGSHNLVLGERNSYEATGGIVVGEDHRVLARGGVALGGTGHTITARHGVVVGGEANRVGAPFGAAVGGRGNVADGTGATVAGGDANRTEGDYATVSGGRGLVESNAFGRK